MEKVHTTKTIPITKYGKDKHLNLSGNRRCDFCTAEEGKLRVVGRFIVQLRSVDVFGTKKLACQTCIRKNREVLISKRLNDKRLMQSKIKQYFSAAFYFKLLISKVGYFFVFVLLLSTAAVAQPSFPSEPNQTPIDGGLGLLAAAGGVYAVRKLSKKNRDDDSLND